MKTVLFLLVGLLATSLCYGQREVKLNDVSKYVVDTVQVCGKVYGGKYLPNAKGTPTFLNVGASFPNQSLTIVIWAEGRKSFMAAPEEQFDQKEICVTGKVEMYKEKPQIVVNEASQMSLDFLVGFYRG